VVNGNVSLILIELGIAQWRQISAPAGAFLVGVALKRPIAERTRKILSPFRDLFAAIFFLFFGMHINPPPVVNRDHGGLARRWYHFL
jgi:CPA2 family monovalent cation:H+ antiporter-2